MMEALESCLSPEATLTRIVSAVIAVLFFWWMFCAAVGLLMFMASLTASDGTWDDSRGVVIMMGMAAAYPFRVMATVIEMVFSSWLIFPIAFCVAVMDAYRKLQEDRERYFGKAESATEKSE